MTASRIRAYDASSDFEATLAVAREIVGEPPYDEARRELSEYPSKHVAAFVPPSSPAAPGGARTTSRRRFASGRSSFVAEAEGGRVVGFCAASFPYWNSVAILDYLVVAPEHRRKGTGAALVAQVEEAARAAGMRRICVQTIAWNVDGIRFYERLGYQARARLPGYFNDQHDMVWLDRALAAS